MKYKFMEHTADMKFQAYGKTLEEAFENSALALREIFTLDNVKKVIKKKEVNVSAPNLEGLLVDFLEEFLFIMDTEGLILFSINNIKISKIEEVYYLKAEINFDKVINYKRITDIKAITYNDMFIKKEKSKFVCQVVVDV